MTDSENLVSFLTKGSSRPHIQKDVIEVFRLAHNLKLDIIPVHLSRSDYRIQAADHGSRFYDPDDWSIDSNTFESLTVNFPVTIDLFAHFSNSHVPRFYSFGNAPNTAGVDAFSRSWDNEVAWCCPPVNLIIAAIKKIAASSMQAVLIVPAWKSSYFWPFLFPNGSYAVDFCVSISQIRPFLIRGPYCSNPLMQGRPSFSFLALYLRSSGSGYSGLSGLIECPRLHYLK